MSPDATLTGLFYGWEQVITGLAQWEIRDHCYLFFPDRRVYDGLPAGGGDWTAFDFAAAERKTPTKTGRYTIDDPRIRIAWAGGRPGESGTLDRARESMKIGEVTLKKVARFNDLRLDGTFEASASGSIAAAGMPNPAWVTRVISARQLVFSHDGHCRRDASFGVHDPHGTIVGHSSEQQGNYRIEGNSLELDFGGERTRHTFFIDPDDEDASQPGLIVIDGKKFAR